MVRVNREIAAAKAEIDKAIVEAEKGNSGELVVAMLNRAGDYGRQEGFIGFGGSLAFFLLAWILIPTFWGLGTALLVGYLGGFAVAKAFPRLCLLLTPKGEVARNVESAASLAFRRLNMGDTKANTGVLIFIVELERTVVVLGDRAIAQKVQEEDWQAIRDAILHGINQAEPVTGLLRGIQLAGELLTKHFPCAADDSDELSSEIHIS